MSFFFFLFLTIPILPTLFSLKIMSSEHSIQVKTPSGMQERKVQVVALKDGRALVTVPEFQAGDALIL